jgi:hypothetical protein
LVEAREGYALRKESIYHIIENIRYYDETLDWTENMAEIREFYAKMAFPQAWPENQAASRHPADEESEMDSEDEIEANAAMNTNQKPHITTSAQRTQQPSKAPHPKATIQQSSNTGLESVVSKLDETMSKFISMQYQQPAQGLTAASLMVAGETNAFDAMERLSQRKRNEVKIIRGHAEGRGGVEVNKFARTIMVDGWRSYIPLPLFGTGDETLDEKIRKGTSYDQKLKELKFEGWEAEEEYELSATQYIKASRSMLKVIEELYPSRYVYWKEYFDTKCETVLESLDPQFEIILCACHRKLNLGHRPNDPTVVRDSTKDDARRIQKRLQEKKSKADAEAAGIAAAQKEIARLIGGSNSGGSGGYGSGYNSGYGGNYGGASGGIGGGRSGPRNS